MNKSTPLNQLPHPASAPNVATVATSNGQNNTFISEQQRQMVAQAQHAAQNFVLPQTTQTSSDILATGDDDATVQEVLNQLNQSSVVQPPAVEPMSGVDSAAPIYHPSLFEPSPAQMAMKAGVAMPFPPMSHVSLPLMAGAGKYGILAFDEDLKVTALVIAAYIMVTLVPVEQFVYHYVSLYKIPYSDLLVKAVLCGMLVYVLMKFV